jgi:hypothetical protein
MGRHINWAGVTFVVPGPTTNTISQVMDVGFEENNEVIQGKGDVALFATRIDVVGIGRSVRVTSEDLAVAAVLSAGDIGTFNAIHKLAGNSAPTAEAGDLVFALSNARLIRLPIAGRHAQYGSMQLEWQAYSSDGETDPLSVTIQGA